MILRSIKNYLMRQFFKRGKKSKAMAERIRQLRRRVLLEALEPRKLMAVINYQIDSPAAYTASNPFGMLDGDVDLKVQIANVGGTPMLQLVDLDKAPADQLVGQSPFTEPIQINITGYSTTVQGKTEEIPEKLVIDLGNSTGFNPAAAPISITLDGIKGTLIPLLNNDEITVAPSSANVYSPASLNVTLNDGAQIGVTGPLNAQGNVVLTSSHGNVEVLAGGSINTSGDITLSAANSAVAQGDADSLDALVLLSPSININSGVLNGNNITLASSAAGNVQIDATDLRDGQFSVGEVVAISTSTIVIDGNSQINAAGNLSIGALSNLTTLVTRGTDNNSNGNANSKDEDAAIAFSAITASAGIRISDSSSLSAGGTANISAVNVVNVTTTADGSLANGNNGNNGSGGTLATATLVGDTEVLVEDSASITAVGNLNITSSSDRTVITTSKATPNGATDDGDSNTQTQGQQTLANNNASTSDGDMTLAAAIAVNTVMGETRALVTGGSLTSTTGSIGINSNATHNIQTLADGTTATGQDGTGVGIAVAIGLAGVTDPTGATALRSTANVAGTVNVSANSVSINASQPNSNFLTEAVSGPSGPSQDQNGNSTGSDVGVAGALAIGVTITNTNAQLDPTANVNANGSNVNISSNSTTYSTVQALPKDDPVSGESLGIGAGIAINITDHTTTASMADGSTLVGANDLSISALSFNEVTTIGKAGAAGGTAIAAAVAFELGHNDTIAQIGTGGTFSNSGNVNVIAVHLGKSTATAEGDAQGASDAAIGAAFAMNMLEDKTEAKVNRSLNSGGAISVIANGNTQTAATATASAEGETDSGSEDDANQQSQNQRDSADSQAAGRGARSSTGSQANPDASTAEGEITVAAAIVINLSNATTGASIADGLTITANGPVNVTSTAHSTASAIADGSANNSETAIGAAVAINSATSENSATIGSGAKVNSDGLTIKASINDAIDMFSAKAISGAGGSDVGVAGSLAINLAEVNSLASIESGAVITIVDGNDIGNSVGPLHIEAFSVTDNKSTAAATADGDTGVGASIAFNIVDNDTRAWIADSAMVNYAHDASILATSKHDVVTKADGGASGGTAITPVGTASLVFIDTEATVGSQAGSLNASGDFAIFAQHSGLVDADAKGLAQGKDAAIGASLGFTYIKENVNANTNRDMVVGGDLTISSKSFAVHTTDAFASASGAAGEKANQGGTAQEKSDNLRKSGNTKSKAKSGADSGEDNQATATTANKDGDSDGDAVTVAAAIAVSIVESSNVAEIADGLSINAGGLLTVKSSNNTDASTQADGSASKGSVGIGAAVSINVVDFDNQAIIGASKITADGVVVEALMTEESPGVNDTHSFSAVSKSGAGGEDVGVAGSLSINHLEIDTIAAIKSSAAITLADGGDFLSLIGPVSIKAESITDNTSHALPDKKLGGAQSDSVGVGASVALNLTYYSTTAEIEDGVAWDGGMASSLTIDALADHTYSTTAENGAKAGEVGIGGAVAVVVAKDHTKARAGKGNGALTTTGAATIHAYHANSQTTKVSSAASGEDAAIGASVGVVIVEDTSLAEVARDVQAGGNVKIESEVEIQSNLNVKASAGGGDDSGNNADTEANNQANQPNAKQNGDNTVPESGKTTDNAKQESEEESGSSGAGVGIAASVAVNALSIKNSALISNGADVTATGSVTVSAPAHVISKTIADSSAIDITSGDVGVGAAVALNWVSLTNTAEIGSESLVMGNGITIQAVTTDNLTNDYSATAFAVAGNTGDAAVAGVVALNVVDADTTARTADNSHLVSSGDVDVNAEHAMRVQAAAIAGTVSTGVSVAAAVAINVIGLNENTDALGGSRTIASIGDSDTNGMGASVAASGEVSVTATHSIDMFPALKLPPAIADLLDTQSIDEPIASMAVSGGGTTGSFAAAGSAGINLHETTTHATVDRFASIGGNSLDVSATDTTNLVTMAGAIGVAADGAGIGLGLDLNILHKDTQATISKQAQVTLDSDLTLAANSTETLNSYAATVGVGNSVGAAGSAAVQVVETTTKATVQDSFDAFDGAAIDAGGKLAISSNGTFSTRMIAGSVGVAGNTGLGAANTTLVHNDIVAARIGQSATVTSAGAVSVEAHSTEDLVTISAAAGGAGTAGVAGSAAVNVLNEDTSATIGDNVSMIVANGAMPGMPGVNVLADDMTTIVSVGGSLAAGGSAGAGIGADVGTLNKDTIASIGKGVKAQVEGDIFVVANSLEDITSVAAGVAASGGASVSVDASVHVLDIKTKAFIDGGHSAKDDSLTNGIHANGNIIVSADDQTQIDKVVGVLAVGSGAAIAGGAAVSTVDKTTEAYIGQGAKVTADGKSTGTTVRTGRFVTTIAPSNSSTPGIESNNTATMTASVGNLQASGEIGLPSLGDAGSDPSGKPYAQDESLNGQRTLGHETINGFRGIAVMATNRDDIEDYSFSLAGASGAAVAVSAGVNVVNANTRAFIGQEATMNEDTSTGHVDQSVHVAAGNDFQHVAFAGSVAVGGGAGVAPAVSVTVLNNNTEAYIGWDAVNSMTAPAIVNARENVSVQAHANEDILLVGAGLGGGTVGIGAGVSVLSFNNHTNAAIGVNSTVFAEGDVLVLSTDDSDIDVIAGGAGGGMVGAGAGVGVLSLNKETQAWIDDGATVDALGGSGVSGIYNGNMIGDGDNFSAAKVAGVVVQSSSTEDLLHLVIAAGGGFVGVAGGVAVSLINSDTAAEIGDDAVINQMHQADAHANQSVYVNAANKAHVTSFAGAVAGGAGAVGGAVEFGTLKNDTLARIGAEAHVSAANDVEVNSLGIKDLDSYTFSGAGGIVGLTAAVSVWSVGTPLTKTYSDEKGSQSNALNGSNGASAQGNATDQAEAGSNEIASSLTKFGKDPKNSKSNSSRVNEIGTTAAAKLMSKTGAPSKSILEDSINSLESSAGTTAKIENFAIVTAGDDISIQANEDMEIDAFVGGFAGGLAGVGASIGVYSVAANATAYSGGVLSAGDQVDVKAKLDEDVKNLALAGSVGVVALGGAVVVVHDSSKVEAVIGSVNWASTVTVLADADQDMTLDTGALVAGGVAAGASVTQLNTQGTVAAGVLGGAQIGQLPGKSVGSLSVTADSTIDAHNTTIAVAGGAVAVSANFAFSKVKNDVEAYVGAGATIDVNGSATVKAVAEHEALADVFTATGGILAAGASLATATLEGNVEADVAAAATIEAGSITVEANLNQDLGEARQAKAVAEAPSAFPGLGAGTGTNSTAGANKNVSSKVGDEAQLNSTSGDITVRSRGRHIANADGLAVSLGLVSSVGISESHATADGNTTVNFEGGSDSSDELIVSAVAKNHAIANATAAAKSLGLSGAGAIVSTSASPIVAAKVDSSSFVLADGEISITALADNKSQSTGSGGAVGGLAGLGAVTTTATGNGQTSAVASADLRGHSLLVSSDVTNSVTATGTSSTGGLLAAGTAVSADVISSPTLISNVDTKAKTTDSVSVIANLTNTPTAAANSITVSGGGAKGGTSATTTSEPTVEALVSGAVTAPSSLTILASDVSTVNTTSGGAALGLFGAAYGEGQVVNKIGGEVTAAIRTGIHESNNVSIQAIESTTVSGQADGLVAGGSALAAAKVVNDVANATTAEISNDVFVNPTIPGTGNVIVHAEDTTEVTAVVDQLEIAAAGAAGAAMTFNGVENSVTASINKIAHVKAQGNVLVTADSVATVHDTTVGVNIGGGGGSTANSAVNAIDTDVEASIAKQANVQAGNNVLVQANGDNKLSVNTTSGAGGLLVGSGGTIVVNTFENETRSFVDENSKVIAGGSGPSLQIRKWDSAGNQSLESLDGLAVIAHSSAGPADDFDGGGPQLPMTVRGENSSGGLVGLNSTNVINTIDDTTEAFIASSEVNTLQKPGDDVIVRAHSDQLSRTFAKGVSGGFAGIGGTINRVDITSQTRAFISDNDETGKDLSFGPSAVFGKNIEVSSVSKEHVDYHAESITGGPAAVGNSASVANIAVTNQAFVRDSEVTSLEGDATQGDLKISASDTASIDGTVSTDSVGGFGAGTATGFNMIENTVQAQVLGGTLWAAGDMAIEANSDESINTQMHALGAGGLAGMAGSVVINTIESTTEATVGDGDFHSQLNSAPPIGTGLPFKQTVSISANDQADITNKQGTQAGGGIAGIGAAVESSNIRNRTVAEVGSSTTIHATDDVSITSNSTRNLDSQVTGFGGGLIGLSGATSLLTMGAPTATEISTILIEFLNVDENNSSLEDQTNDAAATPDVTLGIPDKVGSPSYGITQKAAQKVSALADPSVVEALTPDSYDRITGAIIANAPNAAAKSHVSAGGDFNVNASNHYVIKQKVGTDVVGLVGKGARIGQSIVNNETQATFGNFNTVEANGNIGIVAEDANGSATPIDIVSYGGAAGLVALSSNVADLTLRSDTDARIGNSAEIIRGEVVEVSATQVAHTKSRAQGFGGAALAAAGSISVTPTITANTNAVIGDNAVIGGQRAVGSLTVAATTVNEVVNDLDVANAAAFGGVTDGTDITLIKPNTNAHIGTADVDARGAVLVSAYGSHSATSSIESIAAGGFLGDGAGTSDTKIEGSVVGDIASGAQLKAESLTVSSYQLGAIDTMGLAIGGGLVGAFAASAKGKIDMDVVSEVGDATVTTATNVTVQATSDSDVTATGGSIGVVGFGEGASGAEATILGEVASRVLSGASIEAGRAVDVLADATNTAKATSQATSIGLANGSAAETLAFVDVDTLALVQNSTVNANDSIRVESSATSTTDAKSIGASASLLGAEGSVFSTSKVEGSTRAMADGSLHSDNSFIRVQAHDEGSHATADATVAGGGIGFAVTGNKVHASIQPTAGDNQAQVRARLAGNVSAPKDIAVRAKSTDAYATATANGFTIAGGVASGGTDAQSILGQTLRASIGDGSTVVGGEDVKIEALNSADFSTAISSAAGGALIAGILGAKSDADAVSSVASVVGDATITATGNISVLAHSTNLADATADGVAIGGILGKGDVKANATAGNETTAGVQANATLTATDIVVESISNDRGKSDVIGTGGGLISINSTVAATHIEPLVQAYLGDNVDAGATQDVRVTADARSEGDAEAEANAFGGAAIGDSKSQVDLAPEVTSSVGVNAEIHANRDVKIEALAGQTTPVDGSGASRAESSGSVGGIVGISGTQATVNAKPTVQAIVHERTAGDVPSVSAGQDVFIVSHSKTNAFAKADNDAFGLGASDGRAIVKADIQDTSKAIVESDAEVKAARNLNLSANSTNFSDADAKSGAGAVFNSDARAESQASIDHKTHAIVGNGAKLAAEQAINVSSSSDSKAVSSADADAGSLDVGANANAGVDADDLEVGGRLLGAVIFGSTKSEIGQNATVDGQSVNLAATIERSDGESISDAHVGGAADIDALSRVELYDDAIVNVLSGAQVTGKNSVSLRAETKKVRVNSNAVSKVDGVGGATSDAIGHVQTDSLVETDPGALITTHELSVEALGRTGSSPFHTNATATGTANGAKERGNFDPDRTITFDADVVLTSGNAVLIIAPDGTVLKREGVTFSPMLPNGNVDPAATNIVVSPIVNNQPGTASFKTNSLGSVTYGASDGGGSTTDSAPLGYVKSEATSAGTDPFNITFNETMDAVLIENHSNKNLVIGDILVVNKSVKPDVTIDTERISVAFPGQPPQDIFGFDILQNYATSKIQILQLGPSSSADVILSGLIDNPIGTTEIENVGGDVIQNNLQAIVRSNVLDVEAGGTIGDTVLRLRIELVASEGRPEQDPAALSPAPGFNAGGSVRLDVLGINRDPSISNFVVDVGPIEGDGVDVLLRPAVKETTDPGSSLLVDVAVLPAAPIGYENHFRPDGSGPDSEYPLGIFGTGTQATDATYKFDQITSDGNIRVRRQSSVGGKVRVDADTNSLSGATFVATDGDIQVKEIVGNLRVGSITSSAGNVQLSTQFGDIADANSNALTDISGNAITLQATGAIGSAANPLDINSAVGKISEVNAITIGNIHLIETAGDMNVGMISSSLGHVTLATSSGSIVDAKNDAAVNISGQNLTLTAASAPTVRVGEAADALEICATGVTSFTAPGGTNVHNACGGLKIQFVNSNVGVVSISGSGKVELVDGANVVAQGGLTLMAGTDIEFAPSSQVQADGPINLQAGTNARAGSIGGQIITAGKVIAPRMNVLGGAGHDSIMLRHSLPRGLTQVDAGAGNDVINASAMRDQFLVSGNTGEDLIVIGDPVLARIIGGTGEDTLRLTGAGLSLDLTRVAPDRLTGLETIDITGNGNNSLTLDQSTVNAVSGETNTLVVRRNRGDTVNFGNGWRQVADQSINGTLFNVYVHGRSTLKIQAISSTFAQHAQSMERAVPSNGNLDSKPTLAPSQVKAVQPEDLSLAVKAPGERDPNSVSGPALNDNIDELDWLLAGSSMAQSRKVQSKEFANGVDSLFSDEYGMWETM